MRCWNCSEQLEGRIPHPFPFREMCQHCHAWLHVCKNCRFFNPAAAEQCEVATADFVFDKESFNRCEDFQLRPEFQTQVGEPIRSPDGRTKTGKQRFEELFG